MPSTRGQSNPYDGIAKYYNLLFEDWDQVVESEGQRLEGILGLKGVRSVIDVTCGTGLQCIGLALRGFEVTGCDNSPAMLREARRNARRAGVRVEFVEADLLAMPESLSGRFDAAISCGNSLSHLPTLTELKHAFSAMHSLLRSSGYCVVDSWDYEGMMRDRPAGIYNRVVEVAGKRIIMYDTRSYRGDVVATQFNLLRETGRGWKSAQFAMDLRMWRKEELREALKVAGFGEAVASVAGECLEWVCRKL
ncbi:MAG: class I SAM-dependent methyltransferase [Dehalococcoidia bacterium]|nr:class I SAM-dependent methyltransferase [Dehalococcoidia bacterium]